MATVTEIAPGVHRISVYARELNLQFNHFLILDDEPLLYHTGMRRMFPELLDAVRRVIDPARLRWIGFSHFEVDECGALNEWLRAAPHAQAVHGAIGALVNLADFADRPVKVLAPDEPFCTGAKRFHYRPTPHLPHGWDAGMLFEETEATLFCSDLFHHEGDVEPVTEREIIGRTRAAMVSYQAGPLMDYMPYTTKTRMLLEGLAGLRPRVLATMHGSTYIGDGAAALRELDGVMMDVLGRAEPTDAAYPGAASAR